MKILVTEDFRDERRELHSTHSLQRVTLMTSPHRDEVQIPVDPRTMEPLPAHE